MTAPTTEKQSNALHGPNLILDVENFGPIAEAKNIEFKPMTVFVGPSNTGKTYLAVLMHAFLRSSHVRALPQSTIAEIRRYGYVRINAIHLRDFVLEIDALIRRLPSNFHNDTTEYSLSIPVNGLSETSRGFLQNYVDDHMRLFARRYGHLIQDYFDNNPFKGVKENAENDGNCSAIHWRDSQCRLTLTPGTSQSGYDILDTRFALPPELVDATQYLTSSEIGEDEGLSAIVRRSMADYIETISGNFMLSYYFPSGRSGIMNARQILASQLAARDQAYHLLARDFLSNLVAIRANGSKPLIPDNPATTARNSSITNLKTEHIANVIERSILKGRIIIEESSGLPEFYFVRDQNRVPMTIASSMVTDLAPIVMFLRKFVQLGDLLIIDEPEAHLHPKAQQQMAAALAFMVRSGLRVLITTHSHYMVEQLSAFVNASKLDATTRKRALSLDGALGKEDIYLNEEETAVYSFDHSQTHERGGSVVNEILHGRSNREYSVLDDHSDATVNKPIQSVCKAF